MIIVCWQTILMKYHSLFYSKIFEKNVGKVVCCIRDLRFRGSLICTDAHIFFYFLFQNFIYYYSMTNHKRHILKPIKYVTFHGGNHKLEFLGGYHRTIKYVTFHGGNHKLEFLGGNHRTIKYVTFQGGNHKLEFLGGNHRTIKYVTFHGGT